jgi:spermidine synthase
MIPWKELDRTTLTQGGVMRLMRRDHEFSIKIGAAALMTSRQFGSEEALATLAAERLRDRLKPRVLIGGLGMGFTLRAALCSFGAEARIVAAELVPAVVDWARGPMAELFGDCLDDPRVELVVADVRRLIGSPSVPYDAILLDVDNGPEGMTQLRNDGLYAMPGLCAARAALRPGGVLAVWSQGPDDSFTQKLAMAGFAAEEKRVRARGARGGARHVIWIGTRI